MPRLHPRRKHRISRPPCLGRFAGWDAPVMSVDGPQVPSPWVRFNGGGTRKQRGVPRARGRGASSPGALPARCVRDSHPRAGAAGPSRARRSPRRLRGLPPTLRLRGRRRRRGGGRGQSRALEARKPALEVLEHSGGRGRGHRHPDLVQGSDAPEERPSSSQAPAGVESGGGGGAATAAGGAAEASGSSQGAELVKGASYTLALPHGWARTEADSGATFAASARHGGAEATLWVQRDPSLDFPQFEAQSLAQLRQVAGSAEVTDRTTAPTADGTLVTLAADPPAGAPTYEVTLRLAGPYRYYLATTVEPNASRDAADGAELIHSSFVPVATEKSG